MPEVSQKQLDWYKNVVKEVRFCVEDAEGKYADFDGLAHLRAALRPISNRPTAAELAKGRGSPSWQTKEIAIDVLQGLKAEFEQNGIISKAQNILRDWIAEYKLETTDG